MQIRWLEDFLTLAEARTFARAAERRNLSQPALSRHIQALEAWLGVDLIDRRTQGVQLTPAGRLFRGFSADLLQRTYDMRTVLRGQTPVSDDAVRFSVSHTLSVSFFPGWLNQLKATLGNVVARVNAVNVAEGARALVEGATDLLIVYHQPQLPVLLDPGHYPHVTLATEQMQPYSAPRDDGRPRFRLPGRPEATLPFLSYSAGAYLGQVVESILLAAGERCWLTRSFDTQMAEALKAMVIQGHGVGWLPENCVGREVAEGKVVPAGPSRWRCTMEIRLHRAAERHSPTVDEIWGLLSRATGRPPAPAPGVAQAR